MSRDDGDGDSELETSDFEESTDRTDDQPSDRPAETAGESGPGFGVTAVVAALLVVGFGIARWRQ